MVVVVSQGAVMLMRKQLVGRDGRAAAGPLSSLASDS